MDGKIEIDKICRICMHSSDENLDSLFDLADNIPSQIMACSTVEICINDGLPNKICKLCITEVKNAYQFKIRVEQNDIQMREYLNIPKPIARKRLKIEQEAEDNEVNIKSEVVLDDSNHDPLNQMWKELNADDKDSSNPDDVDDDEDYNENDSSDEDAKIDDEMEARGRLKGIESYSITEDGKFECKLCEKKLADKKGIKLHLRLHTGEKLKICKICDRGFLKPHHLLRHLETHNRKCKECDKKFLTIADYRNHVKEMHSVEKRPKHKKIKKDVTVPLPKTPPDCKIIVCKICDAPFTHIHKLRSHLNEHLDANSYAAIDLHTKEFLFEPSQTVNLANEPKENLINYIANEISMGDKQRLYAIYKRSTGQEMQLTDSETESETASIDESFPGVIGSRRQHQCSICHIIFDRIDKIMDHLVDGHPEDADNFKDRCEICQKVFPNAFILHRHVVSQCGNQKKMYKCEICEQKFMWEDNLRLHCEQCGPSIESIKTRYRKTETGELVCDICQKTFLRKEYLMRHMMTHVPNERKFECPECHKKFNRKDNLRSHLKTHSKDQDMPLPEGQLCVYCGRNFSNSSNLIVHMRRHTGEKPYKCEFCDKGFPRSSDLQCHRRTHTGEKPCLCTICGKGFSRSNKLVRHMRIHTGVRPYQCNHCDRAFTQSNDLTLHVRRHTGERPYVCGVCGDRFIQGTALKAHQKAQQHFDDAKKESPFASISVNNPNRFTNANHVTRVNDGAPLPIKAVRSKSQKNVKVIGQPPTVKQETQMSNDGASVGERSNHSEIGTGQNLTAAGSGPNNFSVPFAIGLPGMSNMGEQLSTLFTISQHYNQSHYGHNHGNQNN